MTQFFLIFCRFELFCFFFFSLVVFYPAVSFSLKLLLVMTAVCSASQKVSTMLTLCTLLIILLIWPEIMQDISKLLTVFGLLHSVVLQWCVKKKCHNKNLNIKHSVTKSSIKWSKLTSNWVILQNLQSVFVFRPQTWWSAVNSCWQEGSELTLLCALRRLLPFRYKCVQNFVYNL